MGEQEEEEEMIEEDTSGKPRRIDELEQARDAVTRYLIGPKLDPIMVFYPTIIEAINELIERRIKDED